MSNEQTKQLTPEQEEQYRKMEEATRKEAAKLVDGEMEEERKRRISEMGKEITDQERVAAMDRLVHVQESLLRQVNYLKAKKTALDEQSQLIQEREAAEKKEIMQQQLKRKAAGKATAEEEEEERRRRMEEDKQDTEHNRILFNSLITVQEELLKQMRLKQVAQQEKFEQQRRVQEDTKSKMQSELLHKVHEKEVKKAVDDERERQTKEMTEEEIERRVAISDKLVTVHKELLTKRQAAKPINPKLTAEVLEEAKFHMQEELVRKKNQKIADKAMDDEKKRRVSESAEPSKDIDEKHTTYQEELTRKASVKEAKRLQEEAKKEYEHEEQRTRLQEDAIRQANQKMADKMATAEQKTRVKESQGKDSPHIDAKLKSEIEKHVKPEL